jgi:alpha-D-xyloside xylohydrolase
MASCGTIPRTRGSATCGRLKSPPGARLFDADGRPGGLTGSYFADARFEHFGWRGRLDARIDILPRQFPPSNTAIQAGLPARGDISVRWEGSVEAETTGDYQFQTYSDGGPQCSGSTASLW